MDPKSHAMAAEIFRQIATGTFSENDVRVAWLTLREHVPRFPLVREFGDFVAHRERDTGRIYNHVSPMLEGFKGYPKTSFKLKVFDETVLYSELSSALTLLKVPVPSTPALRMMLVTTFFMIQFARVMNPLKLKKWDQRIPGEVLGELHPFIRSSQYGLQLEHVDNTQRGATFWFPILWVERDPPGPAEQKWTRPKSPVKVEVRNFALVILSFYEEVTPGQGEAR